MNDYTFGNFIYELRTEKGYSQSELGQMLGVTNKAVSKWENGSAKPNTALIPKLAQILGVTVEELFAGRRFEKDTELSRMKAHLGKLKKKYALISSIYLAVMVTVPLWLTLFISVVMGFKIEDDVAGPLGSVCFIIIFIVSFVSFVIYRKNFRSVWMNDPPELTERFIKRVHVGKVASYTVFGVTVLLMIVLLVMQHISQLSESTVAVGAVYAVLSLISIVSLEAWICFWNVARLLSIRSSGFNRKSIKLSFEEMPTWCKICYVAAQVLLPLNLIIFIVSISHRELTPVRMVFTLLFIVAYLPILVYIMKTKNKK